MSARGGERRGDVRALVSIHVDGREVRAEEGTSLAAALLGAGIVAFRRSCDGEARAPLCGMGVCHECRVTVNGVAHRRACLLAVADRMQVMTAGAEPLERRR